MNNLIGFEKERWYKIVNVGDSTVIQLEGTKLICAKEDDTKRDLQRFQAIAQDDGHFRLTAKYQKTAGVAQVWDYLPHRSLLIQKKQSAAEISTQIWRSETVTGLNCIFFVISVPSPNKCLKNMNSETTGVGQQIKVVDKSEARMLGDNYAYWRLEPELETFDLVPQTTSTPVTVADVPVLITPTAPTYGLVPQTTSTPVTVPDVPVLITPTAPTYGLVPQTTSTPVTVPDVPVLITPTAPTYGLVPQTTSTQVTVPDVPAVSTVTTALSPNVQTQPQEATK